MPVSYTHLDVYKRQLEDIGFSLEKGRALAILGSSGSGKTTLLRCLNFLETPNGGRILVNGNCIFDAADPATQRENEVRKKRLHFGMVFQAFHLFPQYTALENVTLAATLLAQERGASRDELAAIRDKGLELLRTMGLADRAQHYPQDVYKRQEQHRADDVEHQVDDRGALGAAVRADGREHRRDARADVLAEQHIHRARQADQAVIGQRLQNADGRGGRLDDSRERSAREDAEKRVREARHQRDAVSYTHLDVYKRQD